MGMKTNADTIENCIEVSQKINSRTDDMIQQFKILVFIWRK